MPSEKHVGLIGAGTMGELVVQSLVQAGYRVLVYDAFEPALARAQERGGLPAPTPAAVARQAETILMLLPGPPQIEAVVAGEAGLIEAGGPGKTIIDMSTVDPKTTRRLAAQAALVGMDYLDVPILGRPSAHGNWVLPVGGEAHVLERCRPILSVLGREIIHVGPLGAANTLKLLNAMMFSAINAMTAEMMAIAQKAGMEPGVLFSTISGSEAATVSGLFKEVGAKIAARNFDPIFSIDLLAKDNGLAVKMAKGFGAPPLLAGTIQTINELAQAQGLGGEDTSALVKVYEALLNVKREDL